MRSVWSASSLLALLYGVRWIKSGSKLHALQTLRAVGRNEWDAGKRILTMPEDGFSLFQL
jgi:hypothetical protein